MTRPSSTLMIGLRQDGGKIKWAYLKPLQAWNAAKQLQANSRPVISVHPTELGKGSTFTFCIVSPDWLGKQAKFNPKTFTYRPGAFSEFVDWYHMETRGS